MSDLSPHLSAPWPAPRVGDDVDAAIDDAVNTLAGTRRLSWLGDGPTEIHLLASLSYRLNSRLLDAIELARDQDLADADIAHLAGMPLSELRPLLDDLETTWTTDTTEYRRRAATPARPADTDPHGRNRPTT